MIWTSIIGKEAIYYCLFSVLLINWSILINKRLKISKRDLEEMGYTDECRAYIAARRGQKSTGMRRSEACRKHIVEELAKKQGVAGEAVSWKYRNVPGVCSVPARSTAPAMELAVMATMG